MTRHFSGPHLQIDWYAWCMHSLCWQNITNESLYRLFVTANPIQDSIEKLLHRQSKQLEARLKEQGYQLGARLKEQGEQLEARLKEQGEQLEARLKGQGEQLEEQSKQLEARLREQSEQLEEAVHQLSECHKVTVTVDAIVTLPDALKRGCHYRKILQMNVMYKICQ